MPFGSTVCLKLPTTGESLAEPAYNVNTQFHMLDRVPFWRDLCPKST